MRPHENSDNRAILLTSPGVAALAVVRLVGPGVADFLAAHFSRRARAGRAVHGEIRDGDRVVDDAVVVLDPDASRWADVNLHGGEWVVRSFLELARQAGFEVADSARLPLDPLAVDADSMLESEVLTHLPLASTELALRVLLAQPWAWTQFKLRTDVRREDLERILADRALWWLLHPPRVAIVGPPNAGKSTLANQLFAQQRSITADLPGTTRDWVGEIANLDGLAVMLLDTPGLRETADAIESEAIALAKGQIERADLVVLVLDATRPLEPEQSDLLDRFAGAVRVINKTDRAAVWDAPSIRGILTVATTGQGVDDVRAAIRERFGCMELDLGQPRWWTGRQQDVLRRALASPALIHEL